MCTQSILCVKMTCLLVVGDFNARVDSNHPELVKINGVVLRGNHVVGNVNEAGRMLLTLCGKWFKCIEHLV